MPGGEEEREELGGGASCLRSLLPTLVLSLEEKPMTDGLGLTLLSVAITKDLRRVIYKEREARVAQDSGSRHVQERGPR